MGMTAGVILAASAPAISLPVFKMTGGIDDRLTLSCRIELLKPEGVMAPEVKTDASSADVFRSAVPGLRFERAG